MTALKTPLVFAPVVMSGGVGSRLWPLSRASYPKQYQVLVDNHHQHTMLQQTFARLHGLDQVNSQLICNQDHRFLAAEQLRSIGQDADIILEPMGRNTAPAFIIAALRLQQMHRDEPMLVLSADHDIADEPAFHVALSSAHALAAQGFIVTLGITPSFACTGYGYIHCGDAVREGFGVEKFVEKPNQTVAQAYLDAGDYLWNSGMFIVKPSVLLAEALTLCPNLLKQCQNALNGSAKDLDFIRLPVAEFEQCESISIDYAIMEKTQKAVVVPVACGWSDVGDLQSLWQANAKDQWGNVKQGDVLAMGSHNCLLKADSRLLAVLGMEDIAIIETKDAVLVAKLNQAQQVKELVATLAGRNELSHQREVYRPWGSYDSVDSGPNYQVKRISVNPGARLSLQRHQFRAEHWVVVQGQAKVHVDGQDHLLNANDSIYIPKGAVHCLANETHESLHLVEVQSGSYLGEDDIERLEDVYGRH
ncbi:mannose-1-phosphate guanylyltransferase/mannose-6-phosphate isomerase [Oceanospirillaceae bacterium]|jgi:mannose-1-phosphate guanylyltransferase|nr:mannose-1-phosphate guanylyltransferase/mannose-6-phosphate isomerase [bacterium]MDB4214168.1 mannose-1-phosphate guanylyltransferase/mannose-6-phosphate isomerase [Oceanospirillaceae bacterium]